MARISRSLVTASPPSPWPPPASRSPPAPRTHRAAARPTSRNSPTPVAGRCFQPGRPPSPPSTPRSASPGGPRPSGRQLLHHRALKKTQIVEYGYTDTSTSDYGEDHSSPSNSAAPPKSALNLWPEPEWRTKTAANKDTVENKLKKAVCAGTVTFSQARNAILDDWTTALSDLGLS
ncbi:hypothetical protein ACRAWF_25140 [Streptomyces sp. L7]